MRATVTLTGSRAFSKELPVFGAKVVGNSVMSFKQSGWLVEHVGSVR